VPAATIPSVVFDQPEVLRKAGITGIRCIFKDSRKLVWIGTENGLYRFDGTNIIYRRHKPNDQASIPGNTIISIVESKDGNIWIGTHEGIACLNPFNFRCRVYRSELNNLAGNFDNKVIVAPDGGIYSGNSDGVFAYDTKKNIFERIWRNVLPGKSISGYSTAIAIWDKDSLLTGTFNDLVMINIHNHGYRRIRVLNKDILITRILVDKEHRLWLGTWSEGCIVADQKLEKFEAYKWEKDLPSGLNNIITTISEVNLPHEHSIWLAGEKVIIKVPLDNQDDLPDFRNAQVHKEINYGRPATISYMMADDENYIWIGGATITRIRGGTNLFEVVEPQIKGAVENIQELKAGKNNYLCLSFWHSNKGLLLINKETGQRRYIDTIAPKDPFGSNISGVVTDRKGRIWLSSLAGVYILDEKLKPVYALKQGETDPDALGGKKTNEILINHDTVWIACYKKDLELFDLNYHKIKSFNENDGSGLKDDLFTRIFRDRKGEIWLCGNSYFYKYLPVTASFKSYLLSEENAPCRPRDITELPDGNLVIGTETGLVYFNTENETFKKIATPLLEKEEEVTSVTADKEGSIWYLTSAHLVNYAFNTGKFTLFGEEDGLNNTGLQALKSFDGNEILLAQEGSLLKFTPHNWKKKEEAPLLFMHAIQINDSLTQPDHPLTRLDLKYDQNKLYFEFDGISYTKPEQNQYAYKLEGEDREWNVSNRNYALYSNLAPGTYKLHVKAANYAGVWSKENLIDISIRPPFWKTWWFIALSIIFIGGIFSLVVRYISQRNLRERILKLEKEQAVEKERNRIARDMHDDLGSGLTKIAILSEVAKTQLEQKDQASVQLEKISFSSRELVDNLQDIIWVLNPRNDSLENLAAYIREYALKFFDGTDIDVHLNYPNQIPAFKLSEEKRRNMFMVIKESLNNIAKHAACNSVNITLGIKHHQLQLVIADNGKGFEPAEIRQFANGLLNMKARMEQVEGSYEIESVPGKGTITRLFMLL
jgi:signal transduction histidine kinase/ligand-binding sensor domain-containing protein